ncbi:HMG-Y-related protein A-like [Canna indica]|uniref:HMG-Y-related protein A-like n=1 Tax=Canna indica TaxID=4628 RepID=A0AAQ3JV86_9LILI|nr:HMG-Y-related protein A-like [Canna indica]
MATEQDDPRTHSLPPYPQMILDAISTSGDENGTTQPAISEHIDSSHLARTTDAGESYSRPGSDTPPAKRSRGRPPNPKPPSPASSDPPAPKRRGRPPKPVDPCAPVKIPRPRGRPPKHAPSSNGADGDVGVAKRPRGRPPKVKPQFTEVGFV